MARLTVCLKTEVDTGVLKADTNVEGNIHFMLKLYSKGCQYALRALTFVASEKGQERFQAKDICENAKIPEFYTRKILQSLVQGDFLEAHRGPGGGYSLKRPPSDITLLEVIHAVEGEDTFDHCVLGFTECGRARPCPMHKGWIASREVLLAHLSSTSLDQMASLTIKRTLASELSGKRKTDKKSKR